MTEQEALEILKRDDDDMRKGYFCLNDFTALELAKKALEKQIPKKPVMKPEGVILQYPHCPTCEEELFDWHFRVGYCSCGQNLGSEV